jgi:hypothetical protein
MRRVIEKQRRTVAVSTPEKGIPVPSVERMEGFTTTMYAMVKKVVRPAMISVLRLGRGGTPQEESSKFEAGCPGRKPLSI